MKTSLDCVQILYDKLYASAIKTEITGTICMHKRDPGGDKEDIVINSLPAPNQQIQRVIANVNIHVPDLVVSFGDVMDRQPNHDRLKQLADMAIGILKDTWSTDMMYDVQSQDTIDDTEAHDHYINIRIEFFIENV